LTCNLSLAALYVSGCRAVASGEYNRPFLTPALELIPGYRRLQGIVYRKGDPRFEGRSLEDAIGGAISAPDCLMVNRNAGSGTRILTDRLLGGAKPPGYWSQPKSHNAVGVAVAQNRADWGIAIETIAREYGGLDAVDGRDAGTGGGAVGMHGARNDILSRCAAGSQMNGTVTPDPEDKGNTTCSPSELRFVRCGRRERWREVNLAGQSRSEAFRNSQ
jgi:hypothetical protein